MNNKITFPELVQLVADATSTTPRMSELFLKELFATISQSLIDGEEVTIKNLGKFAFTQVAARKSVDVNTGERIEIPGHRKLTFTPDKTLAEAVNMPFAAFEPTELSQELTDEMLQDIDQGNEPTPLVGTEPIVQTTQPAEAEEPATESTDEVAIETVAELPPVSLPVADREPTPDSEPIVASEPEVNPQDTVQAPLMQTGTVETATDTTQAEQPTRDTELIEHDAPSSTRRPFLLGLLTGILATLAIGGIVWAIMSGGSSQPTATSTPPVTDTVTTTAPVATESVKQQVTDTCTASMYLTKMAKKHYGKSDFWVYIYEENIDKIADPNNVPPGTIVIIPSREKYNINPDDNGSIDRARQRAFELMYKRQ